MSGRTPTRFGAILALVAAVAFAAGLASISTVDAQLTDFNWGASVAHSVGVDTGVFAAR
jgi:C4-dicarboxylate transporter